MATNALLANLEAARSGGPLLLSLPAAAKKIGLSAPTVRAMVRAGRLPVMQVGTRHLIVSALLEQALAAQAVSA